MYKTKKFKIDVDEYGHQKFEEDGCQYPGIRTVELKVNGSVLQAYKLTKRREKARIGWGAPAYGE